MKASDSRRQWIQYQFDTDLRLYSRLGSTAINLELIPTRNSLLLWLLLLLLLLLLLRVEVEGWEAVRLRLHLKSHAIHAVL